MPDFNTLLILTFTFTLLAFITAAIIVRDRLSTYHIRANKRLITHNKHWHYFRLYDVPTEEIERQKFYKELGADNGAITAAAAGGFALFFLSLCILLRWIMYPTSKKEALATLAGEAALDDNELRLLTAALT